MPPRREISRPERTTRNNAEYRNANDPSKVRKAFNWKHPYVISSVVSLVVVGAVLIGLGASGMLTPNSSSSDDTIIDVPNPSTSSSTGNIVVPPPSSTTIVIPSSSSSSTVPSSSSSSSSSLQTLTPLPLSAYETQLTARFHANTLSQSDNTNVVSWVNSKDNSLATQGDSTKQPIYSRTGMNGFPSLVFDGTKFMNGPSVHPINSPYTVIVVAKSTCNIQYCSLLTVSTPGVYPNQPVGGHSIIFQKFYTDYNMLPVQDQTFFDGGDEFPMTIPFVVSIVWDGTSMKTYGNEFLKKSDVKAANNVTDASVLIGQPAGTGGHMGHVSLIEIYNRAFDVTSRVIALKTYYGIQ